MKHLVSWPYHRLRNKSKYLSARISKRIFRPNPNRRCLNIGGGADWFYPRWENIDIVTGSPFVDYALDLRMKSRFPIRDESVAMVFSSHCFEHISDDAVLFTLSEIYRVMIPLGTLRVAVPDMDKALEAYRKKDHDFFDHGGVTCKGPNIEGKLVNFFASYATQDYSGGPGVCAEEVTFQLERLDKRSFAAWCVSMIPKDAPYKAHVNAFNYEKMADFLSQSGFRNIQKSEYRRSSVPTMRAEAFDVRPRVSLFVEAVK